MRWLSGTAIGYFPLAAGYRATLRRIVYVVNVCWLALLAVTLGVLTMLRYDRTAEANWLTPALWGSAIVGGVLAGAMVLWGTAGVTGLRPPMSRLPAGLERWLVSASRTARLVIALDLLLAISCVAITGLDSSSDAAGTAIHRRDGYFVDVGGQLSPITETDYRRAQNRGQVDIGAGSGGAFMIYLIGLAFTIWDDEARHTEEDVARARTGWRRRF